ncbi:uncharacterized protein [Pleurodeles waltl]|uniref:uncharacterized protein n=1 Tax=Pleurodeles waltl TaxID=8319 RepID=UPI0037096222
MEDQEPVGNPLPGSVSRSWVKQWTLTAVVWTMFARCLNSSVVQEQVFAPTDSSVFLSAPTKDKLGFVQWTFFSGGEATPIVDYFSAKEDLLITPPYAKKVEFFTSNGSLLLRNVQAADSGVYKVTINLREDEARLIELIIVGPLPHPEIHCNFSLAGSPAEIFCDVPWGEVDSIEWKKDGDSLPHDTCYQIKNRSVLYISKLDPSHCTHYTCNVSNRFYWNESSYNLTFEGAPPTLHTARTFSAAALVTAVTCLLLLVIQFLLPQKILITSNVWRPYTIVLQSLASVASLLLAIAASIWMSQKGVSVAMVLLCVVLLFVVLATSMTVVVLLFCAEKPDFRKRNRGYRIILDSAAPGGVLLDVLFSCLLIEGINKLKGEGCSGVEDQRVLAAVVCLVPLVLGSCAGVFLWYHRKRESNEANDDGEMSEKETCQPIEGRDQPETPMVGQGEQPGQSEDVLEEVAAEMDS